MPTAILCTPRSALERTYPVPVPLVFHAWADPEVKARWFGRHSPEGTKWTFVPAPGGSQRSLGAHEGEEDHLGVALPGEIVPERRIVYTSVLRKTTASAVSLTTVEFSTDGSHDLLVLTETAPTSTAQLPEWREQGTADWLDWDVILQRHARDSVPLVATHSNDDRGGQCVALRDSRPCCLSRWLCGGGRARAGGTFRHAGRRLMQWFFATRSFQHMHGERRRQFRHR